MNEDSCVKNNRKNYRIINNIDSNENTLPITINKNKKLKKLKYSNKYNYNKNLRNKKKKRLNIKTFFIFLIIIIIFIFIIFMFNDKDTLVSFNFSNEDYFIASDQVSVDLYDESFEIVNSVTRGSKVEIIEKNIVNNNNNYTKIKYSGKEYYVLDLNLVKDNLDVVKENQMYVRTSLTLYKGSDSSKILSKIKKGEKLEIIGYDYLKTDGSVNKYEIKYNDMTGYVYGKYLLNNEEDALKNYDEDGIYVYHAQFKDTLGGGSAANLDYYPYEKANFEDNKMPDEVRSLYINSVAIKKVDEYIEIAKDSGINAIVVDIKDNTSPAYESNVMKEYSPTNYKYAINSFEDYKKYIKKIKDAGLYVIGRITVFKDSYYIADHPEDAIMNSKTNKPFEHNGSYWPSAFRRGVWEFNVELAKEAVIEMGFNEIQFDYVRFPDRTNSLEKNGTIDMNNPYNEEKAEAIQSFVMYATDEIHQVGAYVSIDVFGESAHNYVTAYGQYWSAISNVADVISGMPYPDHFSAHNYGIKEVVWTVPYKLLTTWGDYVVEKQERIPTPAKVRTWIQTYDTSKNPKTVYNADMVKEQIRALYDNNLDGGFMTWNSGSSISKYKSLKEAFMEEY